MVVITFEVRLCRPLSKCSRPTLDHYSPRIYAQNMKQTMGSLLKGRTRNQVGHSELEGCTTTHGYNGVSAREALTARKACLHNARADTAFQNGEIAGIETKGRRTEIDERIILNGSRTACRQPRKRTSIAPQIETMFGNERWLGSKSRVCTRLVSL